MLFLTPNQQCQSTEGKLEPYYEVMCDLLVNAVWPILQKCGIYHTQS